MLLRIIRRFVPLVFIASMFATGMPMAPAGQFDVDVATSSVQLTGTDVGRSESHVLSRSVVGDAGELRAATTVTSATAGFRARVENPNDAQLVGFVWTGTPTATLEIRSENDAGWSPWISIETEDMPDPTEEAVKPGIGPIWTGDDAKTFEVRVVHGSLVDLRLDSMHMAVEGSPSGIAVAGAGMNLPRIISRAEWGAQPWASNIEGCGSGPSVARTRMAVIHHTVHSNSYSPAQAYGMVRAIQAFEINSRSFCDLSYNFIVDRYGQIFEGRTHSVWEGVVGGHARGSNTGSIGVALLGQYQPGESPPAASVPAAQYASVRDLLAWKFWWHGVDALSTIYTTSQCSSADGYPNCKWPEGTPIVLPAVVGHRDVTRTSCPGDLVVPLINRLKFDIAARVVTGGPWHPLDGVRWQPESGGPAVVTLDAFGGLHPAGSAGSVPFNGYWPGWGIVRAAAGSPTAGYVLDGWGGVYPYGSAQPAATSGYFQGWDIARGIAVTASGNGGYVLDGWGGIHRFGSAPPVTGPGYWYGWDIARDIVLLPGGGGGYVLDGWGGVHAFGSAPQATGVGYFYGWDIARAIALNPDGPGGYVLDGWGGVHPWGGAPSLGISRYTSAVDHRDLVVLPGGRGYVLDANGNVFPVGAAPGRSESLTWTGYGIGRSIVAAG